MVELVRVIAESLVDEKESVEVTSREDGKTTVIMLKVAEKDMGKVIGKKGRIAKALRVVVKSAAMKERKDIVVEIVE